MTSQPGKQTIAIRILPNRSRSKSNQTMKFGQLTEYVMRNIFLGEGTLPKPFSKNSISSIYLGQYSKVYSTLCFYCMPS